MSQLVPIKAASLGNSLCVDPQAPARPMHASTGINRCMHEFQNRPTAGSSDRPGCARRQAPMRRTRDALLGRSGLAKQARVVGGVAMR
jgi:hypothetical protein